MTRCVCCDLPIASCGAEIERRQRAEATVARLRALDQPGVFAASYDGPCICGEWFKAGAPITRGKQAGTWRAVLCCEAAS
jgi:hypothetical protein